MDGNVCLFGNSSSSAVCNVAVDGMEEDGKEPVTL